MCILTHIYICYIYIAYTMYMNIHCKHTDIYGNGCFQPKILIYARFQRKYPHILGIEYEEHEILEITLNSFLY